MSRERCMCGSECTELPGGLRICSSKDYPHVWHGIGGVHQPGLVALARAYMDMRDLVEHCWLHSAYPDCGYRKMTASQRHLYCDVIGANKAERDEQLAQDQP